MALNSAALKDYVLIAQATDGDEKFHMRMKHALEIAVSMHPGVAWRGDISLGPSRRVGVFSAPDAGIARQVWRIVGALRSVKAELSSLRSRG